MATKGTRNKGVREIMCVFTKTMFNPRYKAGIKNGGIIPPVPDMRVLSIEAKCGTCIECRRERASEWQIRLTEEAKAQGYHGHFVTLTFDEEHMNKLAEEVGDDADEIAKVALRRYLELWRKKHKSRPKHWFVNELGHKNTERLHLHGVIFTEESKEEVLKYWRYGAQKYCGYSFGEKVIGYITKYITKDDPTHKGWKGRVLCSPGIGKSYVEDSHIQEQHRFKGENTNVFYRTKQGHKKSMPTYYKRKLWSDAERETLRLTKMDKGEITIGGIKLRNKSKKERIIVWETMMQRREKLIGLQMGPRRRRHYTARGGMEIDKLNRKQELEKLCRRSQKEESFHDGREPAKDGTFADGQRAGRFIGANAEWRCELQSQWDFEQWLWTKCTMPESWNVNPWDA